MDLHFSASTACIFLAVPYPLNTLPFENQYIQSFANFQQLKCTYHHPFNFTVMPFYFKRLYGKTGCREQYLGHCLSKQEKATWMTLNKSGSTQFLDG